MQADNIDELHTATANHFWSKVRRAGPQDCWPYLGTKGSRRLRNYGRCYWVPGKVISAHRVAWILTHGFVPSGLHVLHKCDNPPCCNPNHLFVGTNLDNVQDAIAKKRRDPRNNGRLKMSAAMLSSIQKTLELEPLLTRDEIGQRFNLSRSTLMRYRIGNRPPGHYAQWRKTPAS